MDHTFPLIGKHLQQKPGWLFYSKNTAVVKRFKCELFASLLTMRFAGVGGWGWLSRTAVKRMKHPSCLIWYLTCRIQGCVAFVLYIHCCLYRCPWLGLGRKRLVCAWRPRETGIQFDLHTTCVGCPCLPTPTWVGCVRLMTGCCKVLVAVAVVFPAVRWTELLNITAVRAVVGCVKGCWCWLCWMKAAESGVRCLKAGKLRCKRDGYKSS